ncbi:MAG: MORN repeat-containing protein [Maribacter sp.]
MNIKKYGFLTVLIIAAASAIFFFLKNKKLQDELTQTQNVQSSLFEKLRQYEELVHIDSMLLKGDYDTALNSYNETLKIHEENKMGIPVRIALAEKFLDVQRASKNQIGTAIIEEKALEEIVTEETPKSLRKLDSLQFTLKKTKVQLASLKRQLKSKSFGEYLKFKSKKGNQIHYVGQVKNGKANGFGIALLDTGSRYEGQWKNNQRNGDGTFYWADGEYYVGTYNNDKRSGYGTYFWPNGEKYAGEWKEDKRSGSGEIYNATGDVVAGGEWNDDKLVQVNKK